jgi:hypothetical protein
VSYDLAPPPSPFSIEQVVSLFQSSCVSRIELTNGKGAGVGEEANHYDSEKARSSKNHSILSVFNN